MSQVAFAWAAAGSAFQTLPMSTAPNAPSVVTTTSTFVFASRAVKMPVGSPDPDPTVNFCSARSSYPAFRRREISVAKPG